MNAQSTSRKWDVGRGKYSRIIKTTFERIVCVVKAVARYRDRSDVNALNSTLRKREADEEERGDIVTERAILLNRPLVESLDWKWLPTMYATFDYKELDESAALQTAMKPLGFAPAALFYMELLDEQLDQYIQRVAVTAEGAKEALKLMCDLLATVVALSRNGVRHNDMMFRNIMVRHRKPQMNDSDNNERVLELKRRGQAGSLLCKWNVNTACDIVVIDFGLSSVDEKKSPLRKVPFIITHKAREALYAGIPTEDDATMHPLVLPKDYPLRPCVDIHCIAHSLRSLASKKALHKSFREWCNKFISIMENIHKQSSHGIDCPPIEDIVALLIPRTVLNRPNARNKQ